MATALDVMPGRAVSLRVLVPPGPRHEVYLRFLHGRAQIAPCRVGMWFRPDDVLLVYPLDYEVPVGETRFYLEGASPDANFDHAFDFEVLIDVSKEQAPLQPTGSLTGKFLNALGLGS